MPQNKQNRKNERGNVFILILLGVVLFVALAFTISRSMRSDTTNQLSDREAELAASEIIAYAQRVERAINRMRRKGISESDLSFDQTYVAGYAHGQPDTNKVFHPNGGNVAYLEPLSEWLADFTTPPDLHGEWYIPQSARILRLGPNGLDNTESNSDSIDNEELLLVLPYIKREICVELNKMLGISTDDTLPVDSNHMWSGTNPKFAGALVDSSAAIEAGGGGPSITNKPAACVEGTTHPASGTYHFYYALIIR